jgi:nucleoside-diphosphate-sugar epimerase
MTETILVTGGTGYLGGWCIVEALKRGYGVRTSVRDVAKADAIRAALGEAGIDASAVEAVAADLSHDDGWDAAMAGVNYVLHVASPISPEGVKRADDYVRPARDGALRVLRAAVRAGVKRVVMTSSCAACAPHDVTHETVSDETVWSDPKQQANDWYRLSKTLAERAAWDFMLSEGGATQFSTILPAAIFGPVLGRDSRSSVILIERLLGGAMPGIPNFGVCVVDVRDVADLHLRAMVAPEAAGERFIAAGKFMWMHEIAATLRARLGDRAAKVPTRRLPDMAIRVGALFDAQLKPMANLLGRLVSYSSAKAERVLGWRRRAEEDSVTECAASLQR